MVIVFAHGLEGKSSIILLTYLDFCQPVGLESSYRGNGFALRMSFHTILFIEAENNQDAVGIKKRQKGD